MALAQINASKYILHVHLCINKYVYSVASNFKSIKTSIPVFVF